ncbi:MAG TPA: hypothetical protein VFJ92_07155 [Gemmatimonadales bacterium]|jgi:hypothetical protein|nr:hypothetical protein [Gemmatimonadales bacterium]
MDRVFLLSPAHAGGKRAELLLRDGAAFPLAARLRGAEGIALGEAFSFMSGLYFRGKLAYARQFGRPPEGLAGALVITANRGLLPADTPVRPDDLRALGLVDIRSTDPRYRAPLLADLDRLRSMPDLDPVLLGSVATGKYVDVLLEALGDRLRFPPAFVGRGDMSRGGLLLRAARSGVELDYIAVHGADRRGPRPPRLEPVAVTPVGRPDKARRSAG